MLVQAESEDQQQKVKGVDIKNLKFEPVLNVKEAVKLNGSGNNFYKCSVSSELGILGINEADRFFCVNMKTNSLIFQKSAKGQHNHHWLRNNGKMCLCFQTLSNEIRFFMFDDQDASFRACTAKTIALEQSESIQYSEFDRNFEHIFIVRNRNVLEKRNVADINKVVMSVTLNQTVDASAPTKQLPLSQDGSTCAIGGGYSRHFHLIDLVNQEQYKVKAPVMARCLCFINGDAEFAAIGGGSGESVRICDCKSRTFVREVNSASRFINCLTSTNNILAIATNEGVLHLLDVRTWEPFHSSTFDTKPYSLHLTTDSKYLTVGGSDSVCVVLQVQ